MTQKEKTVLDKILDNQEQFKGTINDLSGKVDGIHRAVYGDPVNGYRGLVERQAEDDKRYGKLIKALGVATGVISTLIILFKTNIITL